MEETAEETLKDKSPLDVGRALILSNLTRFADANEAHFPDRVPSFPTAASDIFSRFRRVSAAVSGSL